MSSKFIPFSGFDMISTVVLEPDTALMLNLPNTGARQKIDFSSKVLSIDTALTTWANCIQTNYQNVANIYDTTNNNFIEMVPSEPSEFIQMVNYWEIDFMTPQIDGSVNVELKIESGAFVKAVGSLDVTNAPVGVVQTIAFSFISNTDTWPTLTSSKTGASISSGLGLGFYMFSENKAINGVEVSRIKRTTTSYNSRTTCKRQT